MNGEEKTTGFGRWNALLFLIPAALAAALVFLTLPLTQPVLAEIPARLEWVPPPTAEEPEPEVRELEQEPEEVETVEAAQLVAALGNYPDGVYTGSAQGYGGAIKVQVTVENGQIVDVTILSAAGETDAFFNRAMGVVAQVLLRQTWKVDIVSGATYSSRGILGAIQNALTGETVVNEAPPETEERSVERESFTEPAAYRDGTYTGSARGFGGTIQVEVVISDGKIQSIRVISAPGETASYLNRAKNVISAILRAGSPNVNAVSGATYSSTGIINAVKRALNKAAADGREEDVTEVQPTEPEISETPVELPEIDPDARPQQNLADGVYLGTGEGFGGDIVVQVTVRDGRITDVTVVSAEDETPAYLNRASTLIPYILSSQSTEVDAVSGATYSSRGILEAAQDALSQAVIQKSDPPGKPEKTGEEQPDDPQPGKDKPGNEERPEESRVYADGIYSATGWCADEDETFRYELTVSVTIQDGKITQVDVEKGADESEEPEDNERYLGFAIDGRTRRDVTYPGVPEQIVSHQSADDVDIVSSATYSSSAIRELAAEALAQAVIADDPAPGSGDEEGGEVPEDEHPSEEEPGEEEPVEEEPGEEHPAEDEPGEEEPVEEEPVEEEPVEADPADGDESEEDAGAYTDGTYSVTGWCEDASGTFRYELTVTVTVSDGTITGVGVTKGTDESEEPEDNELYLGFAVDGRTRRNVTYPGIPKQIVENQSTDQVEIVSSATYSSKTILKLAEQALKQAAGGAR